MKYVMFEQTTEGITRRTPIIFPDVIVHADIARALRRISEFATAKVVSAGRVEFPDGRVVCYGESETLGLSHLPEDAAVINMIDQTYGIVGKGKPAI